MREVLWFGGYMWLWWILEGFLRWFLRVFLWFFRGVPVVFWMFPVVFQDDKADAILDFAAAEVS